MYFSCFFYTEKIEEEEVEYLVSVNKHIIYNNKSFTFVETIARRVSTFYV